VSLKDRDRLAFRVTPRELVVDEIGVGAGTVVEHEIARRLHRAHVATFDVDRGASPRDLSRFCSDLSHCDEFANAQATFAELLTEHGVDTIVLRMAYRPEVFDVGAPRAPLRDLVEHERGRRQAAATPASSVRHLYPPDKGWVRVDPAAGFDTISLIDLVILVDDPTEVATMLLRLTDDEAIGADARNTALEQKFSDVSTLFASLEPRLASVMFAKLARAVLDLGPERRNDLLRRTILPGLLDGRADGTVLRDFPDLNLAESLCLLLDLETAAPELLTTALDRLGLSPERREAVVPLIETQLRTGEAPGALTDARGRKPGIDRYAQRLIHVEAMAGKSFAEHAAFDFSIDDQAAATIAGVGDLIGATDLPATQLQCLWNLVRLEANPSMAETFLRRASVAFAELERSKRWRHLATWVRQYGQLAESLGASRPDVADAISIALSAFCVPDRAARMAELQENNAEGQTMASALVESFGVAIAPAFVALLDDPAAQSKARVVVSLMSEHARLLAPALVTRLGNCGVAATRVIVRVLGFAGHGYETAVAEQLSHPDEQTGREALRALARIGTAQAASVVALQIRQGASRGREAAEEALWHFPPAQAAAQLRDLLGRREFVLHSPQVAARLLDRAAQSGTDGLDQVLTALAPLRFRFWNPALVRVAVKARQLLRRPHPPRR
jgi:hypothetical protein